MIEPKVKIGDKVKVVSVKELQALYDKEYNKHKLNTLTWLSQQNLTGTVVDVTVVGLDLWSYTIKFGIVTVNLYDSDFNKVVLPTGELYKGVKVYLCVDSQGGMCDRLCFGEQALIDNANATIDTWNDGQSAEHYDYVHDVNKAHSILTVDNFDVVELKPNTVHLTEDYIVSDIEITTYGAFDILCHSPKHIWNLLVAGKIDKTIIDLTVATDDDII